MFDREKIGLIHKWWLSLDKNIFLLSVGLILLSILFVYTSSPTTANKLGLGSTFFLRKHIFFCVIGVGGMIFLSTINENQLKLISVSGFFACLLLMVAVLLFGAKIKGARRWIYLLGFSIQPSEIIKPFYIMVTAYLLTSFRGNRLGRLLVATIPFAAVAVLLLMQPDIGMLVLMILLFIAMLFLAMTPIKWLLYMGLAALAAGGLLYVALPHFTERINSFFALNTANYQVEKSLEAYSYGGMLGRGPLEGTVKNYIPDAHTDFIFSAIGEEFGFITCFLVVAIFFYICFRILMKGMEEQDNFKYLAANGLAIQILLQACINICVTLNLLPTTGMAMPLISYGGSAMLSACISIGLILCLTRTAHIRNSNINEIIV